VFSIDVQAKGNLVLISAFCIWLYTASAYQTADNSAQIEDYPKPGDISAFEFLGWIRHHNRPLRRPENACTTSKHGASEHNITEVFGMVVT
jgi:hypothetical protein